MQISPQTWASGWKLCGAISAGLLIMAATAFLTAPDTLAGLRLVIRLTARTSLALFLLAFTASALCRLFPSAFTGWLRLNRRYIGVSFAVSHFIHAAAIISLAQADYALFLKLTNIVTYIGGGTAYAFIMLMVLTSFDRTAAIIGPQTWRWLHTTGMWYIWLSFALNFGKRIPANSLYLVPVVFILAALAVRIIAWRRKNLQKQAPA